MEFVYVVKRSQLFDLAYPQGFQRLSGSELDRHFLSRIRERGFFVERRHAERDSSLKQIIPYCVVKQGEKILLLRRLGKQGEARLHKKLSIGVGGHINPIDHQGDILAAGTKREIEEELEIRGPYRVEPIGIINDDATEVGSVHFGLVQTVTVAEGDVGIREKDMMEGNFVPPSELRALSREEGAFESWSQFLIEKLDLVQG